MTQRTQRRAAERKALKETRRRENDQFAQSAPAPEAIPAPAAAVAPPLPRPVSAAQFTANRANAQLSHGPASPEGKAISSRNHTQHGLTAQPCGPLRVLPGEDQSAFDALLADYTQEWQPATATELDLVQRLATHSWLRSRATCLQDQVLLAAGGNTLEMDFKAFQLFARYQTLHARGYAKALTDLMRLRNFQLRHRKEEANMQCRADESSGKIQIRFESHKLKAEAHAVRMETARLRQEALKQRNQRLDKSSSAAPVPQFPSETVAEAAA